jgi:adenine-specific DNA-methyltransferase
MSEQIRILKPRKTLNKAFLKVKPNRTEIESFKTNLSQLLDRINDSESEEFHKNLVSDFLKDTYYKQNHFIIEAKKPTNKAEMLTKDKVNVMQGTNCYQAETVILPLMTIITCISRL